MLGRPQSPGGHLADNDLLSRVIGVVNDTGVPSGGVGLSARTDSERLRALDLDGDGTWTFQYGYQPALLRRGPEQLHEHHRLRVPTIPARR